MRGTRQLPTEHIQFVMVIKKEGLKQATPKLSYLRGETVEETEVDILGCISVKCKASNEIIQSVKCSKLWTDRVIIFKRPSMTVAQERQQCHICLNSLRHMWTCVTVSSNPPNATGWHVCNRDHVWKKEVIVACCHLLSLSKSQLTDTIHSAEVKQKHCFLGKHLKTTEFDFI